MPNDTFSRLHRFYHEGVRTFEGTDLKGSAISSFILRDCQFQELAADLSTFEDATFEGCTFRSGSFRGTELRRAVLFASCRFENVDFSGARMAGSVFEQCTFIDPVFNRAELYGVRFVSSLLHSPNFLRSRLEQVSLSKTSITNAELTGTLVLATDLDPFCPTSARRPYVDQPVIDWRSVTRSVRAQGLDSLLTWCGMPDVFVAYIIDCARALDPDMLFSLMRSTFISYGEPDRAFASALAAKLEENGVRTFLFYRDAPPGARLHRTMFEGVNKYDRVILVCSKESLNRAGVRNEIEETFARESRDGGASYLIPVSRDDYVYHTSDPLLIRIRDRVVADFRGIDVQSERFVAPLQQLLRSLRLKEPGA